MREWTIDHLLDQIGKTGPDPGGGGVSCLVSAMAVGLDRMALETGKRSLKVRLERIKGKKTSPETDPVKEIRGIETDLARIEERISYLAAKQDLLMDLAVKDGRSFQQVLDAYKLDKSDPGRLQAIQDGYLLATEVPLLILDELIDLYEFQVQIVAEAKRSIISDVMAACGFIQASMTNVLDNIRENVAQLDDPDRYQQIRKRVEEISLRREGMDRLVDQWRLGNLPSFEQWKEKE